MSAKKRKASIVVVQVVAIIVFVLAVLSTAATLMVRSATNTADEQQQVPSMLGKQFLPARDAKFEKINIQNGSLVLLKEVAESGVQTNDVAVFTTPAGFNDNSIYRTFSLGRIIDMSTTGDVVQYSIEGLGENGDIILESSSIVGIAGWQMPQVGNLVGIAIGSGGIIYLIVVPFFLFVVLQLLAIILRTVFSSGQKTDEEDDEDLPRRALADSDSDQQPDRYDQIKEKETEPAGGYVTQEALEPISLKFKKKEIQAAFQDVKSQTFTTIPPEDVPTFTKQEMEQLRPVKKEEPVAEPVQTPLAIEPTTVAPQQPAASSVDVSEDIARILAESVRDTHKEERDAEPENPVFGLLDERRAPERSDEFRSVLDMVDDLLSDIKEEQKHSVFKMEQEATQEFRVEHVRERMQQADPLGEKSGNFVQNAKSQEILDNILIELKDNALDVQFRNVKSKAVDIEKIPSGDGFTIDTPRYKANVKIEIDKK